jgi:hypothetical protein
VAKIRGVKPEFWTDEDIVELTPLARLLYIGLWNYACDNGHLEDRPKQIKMRVLPGDDCSVADLLRELDEKGRIDRSGGWIVVPNLTEHQRIDKRFFATCDMPGCVRPEAESANPQRKTRRAPGENTTSAQREPVVGTLGSPGDGDGDGDGDGELGAHGRTARKRAHQLPDEFEPNETNRRIASERGVDLQTAFEQFTDHHRAKGSTYKDWHLALNTWLRRERPSVHPLRSTFRPPEAHELEQPPDGLSPAEYAKWERELRAKRANA